MSQNKADSRSHVLDGGGEMGEMIRAYDWSATSLGPIDAWPSSLRTTLGLLLHTGFPMFLMWGPELICFYNDAFRPSLGNNGKHPAIGKKGREVWADVWHFAGPLMDGVMQTGKPVYYEDQLVGFYRNGRMEDIYWTFSYSPAYDDDGNIHGVLITCTETTKNMQTIRRLEESERRFRTLAESTDILIALSDEEGHATYFNKAWEDFTGRSQEALHDYGWADLVHEEDRKVFLNLYQRAREKKESWVGEFRMRNKEGQYRWLLSNGPARFRADGSFAGYISSSIDITDRKKAERQLQISEHRLRGVIENAPFPIGIYVGREMRIVFVNQAILDAWGKGNDVVGKLYAEVLPELESQQIYPQLDRVYTTGVPFHARDQRVDLLVDGMLQSFYFNYSFTPLYNMEGEIYGVMNTAADLTSLHLAKQRVEQSEKNLRNMVLQAPVAMCILAGPNHVVEVVNDLMIALWGKPRESVMNKPIFEGLPDARDQGLEAVMANVYYTGETFTASERPVNLLRSGKLEAVYQNFVYEPYRDSDGTILGVLAITIDVTEQVLARQKIEEVVASRTHELKVANQDLARSNAELAQFAYIASHDLQEPLRKIRTFAQMLDKNLAGSLDAASRNYLDKIQTSASRMHMLIRDVLTYSELDRMHDAFETVDLNQVLQNTCADFELLIEQKGATIVADPLPLVQAVPLQMAQLFGNLISNALKYSRPGVAPIITITAHQTPGTAWEGVPLPEQKLYHIVTVRDNGIGLKKEFAGQIFNIFQRLHRKDEFEGTGIGLAICKKIAVRHYGDIHAFGSSEYGAVFTIALPVLQ
jgi:PAS domain S-box-containing protein